MVVVVDHPPQKRLVATQHFNDRQSNEGQNFHLRLQIRNDDASRWLKVSLEFVLHSTSFSLVLGCMVHCSEHAHRLFVWSVIGLVIKEIILCQSGVDGED